MKPDRAYIVARLAELSKTQSSLGQALNIDRAQVTRLLNGSRRVRLDEVETIARFLDISTIEMLRRLGLNL
jgi:transcriptional regulator with XRE-family HTH domain